MQIGSSQHQEPRRPGLRFLMLATETDLRVSPPGPCERIQWIQLSPPAEGTNDIEGNIGRTEASRGAQIR